MSRKVRFLIWSCILIPLVLKANDAPADAGNLVITGYIGADAVWMIPKSVRIYLLDSKDQIVQLTLAEIREDSETKNLRMFLGDDRIETKSPIAKTLIHNLDKLKGTFSGQNSWKNEKVNILIELLADNSSKKRVSIHSLIESQPSAAFFTELQSYQKAAPQAQ